MSGVHFDRKLGLNPSLINCFFCGKSKAVALLGIHAGTIRKMLGMSPGMKAPRELVVDQEPCDECKDYMKEGVIFISVEDGQRENKARNPRRTGRLCVLKDEGVIEMMTPSELRDDILKQRICFIEDSSWGALCLPTEEIDNRGKADE